MSSYVSAELRRPVWARAASLCEYCLIHEEDTVYGCEVDHVISEKHHGPTTLDNLALACWFCNNSKGSDLGSLDPATGRLIRFFNPRTDRWSNHFRLDGVEIQPITVVGRVTERILAFNDFDRIEERGLLHLDGRYPSPAAWRHIRG
jgi:hypothetical protein